MDGLAERRDFAVSICREAGHVAMEYFRNRHDLVVDKKGAQDWVSQADREVELFLRKRLEDTWQEDGIYGEEHADRSGSSGFDWVIDPIDGTTNFVNGVPAWTVVLAGVEEGRTQIGVIYEPNADEMFVASRGGGAMLNGHEMRVSEHVPLGSGTVAVGYSNRVESRNIQPVIASLVDGGAMFYRNASGALSLAYVAAGRMLGYLEEHMNAWDCLAGQLLVEEAGGRVEVQDASEMIRSGGRVVVGASDVFEQLLSIANDAWGAPPR